ncbi:hypothetical protein G7054_g2143 [Neopestalotiopsis clavispora]|nr:hypothetical protein G7054_g2143 [Neopestalotiopsis clavispora]
MVIGWFLAPRQRERWKKKKLLGPIWSALPPPPNHIPAAYKARLLPWYSWYLAGDGQWHGRGRGGGAASSSSFPLPRTITGNELARTQGPTGPVMMGDKGSPPSVGPSRSLEDEERSGSQVEAVFCALVNDGQRWPTPVPCPVRVPL